MPAVAVPVSVVQVHWVCEECGAPMAFVPRQQVQGAPNLLEHRCQAQHVKFLDMQYPRIEFRPIQQGPTREEVEAKLRAKEMLALAGTRPPLKVEGEELEKEADSGPAGSDSIPQEKPVLRPLAGSSTADQPLPSEPNIRTRPTGEV